MTPKCDIARSGISAALTPAMAKGVLEPLMLIGAPSGAKPPSPVTSESGGDSDS